MADCTVVQIESDCENMKSGENTDTDSNISVIVDNPLQSDEDSEGHVGVFDYVDTKKKSVLPPLDKVNVTNAPENKCDKLDNLNVRNNKNYSKSDDTTDLSTNNGISDIHMIKAHTGADVSTVHCDINENDDCNVGVFDYMPVLKPLNYSTFHSDKTISGCTTAIKLPSSDFPLNATKTNQSCKSFEILSYDKYDSLGSSNVRDASKHTNDQTYKDISITEKDYENRNITSGVQWASPDNRYGPHKATYTVYNSEVGRYEIPGTKSDSRNKLNCYKDCDVTCDNPCAAHYGKNHVMDERLSENDRLLKRSSNEDCTDDDGEITGNSDLIRSYGTIAKYRDTNQEHERASEEVEKCLTNERKISAGSLECGEATQLRELQERDKMFGGINRSSTTLDRASPNFICLSPFMNSMQAYPSYIDTDRQPVNRRKQKRKKEKEQPKLAEDCESYQGNKSLEEVLAFINKGQVEAEPVKRLDKDVKKQKKRSSNMGESCNDSETALSEVDKSSKADSLLEYESAQSESNMSSKLSIKTDSNEANSDETDSIISSVQDHSFSDGGVDLRPSDKEFITVHKKKKTKVLPKGSVSSSRDFDRYNRYNAVEQRLDRPRRSMPSTTSSSFNNETSRKIAKAVDAVKTDYPDCKQHDTLDNDGIICVKAMSNNISHSDASSKLDSSRCSSSSIRTDSSSYSHVVCESHCDNFCPTGFPDLRRNSTGDVGDSLGKAEVDYPVTKAPQISYASIAAANVAKGNANKSTITKCKERRHSLDLTSDNTLVNENATGLKELSQGYPPPGCGKQSSTPVLRPVCGNNTGDRKSVV